MRCFLFILVFTLLSDLRAEKIVQCVTYSPIDAEWYTQALQERGYEGRVVATNIKEYEASLLKRSGFFHRLLRRWSLDYPWSVPLAPEVDKVVFFNVKPSVCKKYDLSRFPREKLVLFMWEPPTVLPKMYKTRLQGYFPKIYTWDDTLVDEIRYFKFHYPVWTPAILEEIPFEEKKLCTLISSDIKGHGKHELYSARKEAIRYFENVKEEGFEFYGRRWDKAQYPSYRGIVEDKLETMKRYRFCICYENTKEISGYITEKIFDCFAALTVPIYWGASNVEASIPKGCFVDRRDFANLEELHAFMKGMSKETHEGYLGRIKAFLKSDAVQPFTSAALAQTFYEAVTQ